MSSQSISLDICTLEQMTNLKSRKNFKPWLKYFIVNFSDIFQKTDQIQNIIYKKHFGNHWSVMLVKW